MDRFKKFLLLAASLMLVLAIVTVLGTKEARGTLIATLVQVVNTTSSPVPNRDVDNPANQPFSANIGIRPFVPSSFNVPATTGSGQPVRRLVIEEVDGNCSVATGTTLFTLQLSTVANGVNTQHFLPFSGIGVVGGGEVNGAESTRLYADPGTSVSIAQNSSDNRVECGVNISGYLVTQ